MGIGKLLEEVDADEMVFGNRFERSIRDNLPWGTAVAVRFIKWVDATLSLHFIPRTRFSLSLSLSLPHSHASSCSF